MKKVPRDLFGPQGATGNTGPGPIGPTGFIGNTGPAGSTGLGAYGDVYFSYTGGVQTPVPVGTAFPFPNTSVLYNITRDPILNTTVFILPLIGVYLIQTCFTIIGGATTLVALDSNTGIFVNQLSTVFSQSSVSGSDILYVTMSVITITVSPSRILFKNGNTSGNINLPSAPFPATSATVIPPTGHLLITKIG